METGDMIRQIADDYEAAQKAKASAGQKMTWDELAEALKGSEQARLASEQKLAAVQNESKELRRSAGVAVALAHGSLARVRKWMTSENLAAMWYAAFAQQAGVRLAGNPLVPWEELHPKTRLETIAVAKGVVEKFSEMEEAEARVTDEISADILQEGESLAIAMQKLTQVCLAYQGLWQYLIAANRSLANAGIQLLPPGTIVHGANPSTHPHRMD